MYAAPCASPVYPLCSPHSVHPCPPHVHPLCTPCAKSVRPEVRGTTDFNGGAYPLSKASPSYARTTLINFRCEGERPETDGYNFQRRGHSLRTVLTHFEARGVHLSLATYEQLLAPQVIYLLLSR